MTDREQYKGEWMDRRWAGGRQRGGEAERERERSVSDGWRESMA